MPRPVDAVIEFLQAEQARGKTHILLDETALDGLRDLHVRSRGIQKPLATIEKPASTAMPAASVSTCVIPNNGSKAERLASLKKQAASWGPTKALGTLRETLVFATGTPDASIMFFGDVPGYEEEKKIEPFVGAAGQKLNEILKAMGIARQDTYLSNVVKFRPASKNQITNTRKPTSEEIAACVPLIREEIGIVQPKCIVALGGIAAEGLLGINGEIESMRGQWHQLNGIPLRVSHHPSYLLGTHADLTIKRQLWEDMLAVMEKIDLPISEKQRKFFQ